MLEGISGQLRFIDDFPMVSKRFIPQTFVPINLLQYCMIFRFVIKVVLRWGTLYF